MIACIMDNFQSQTDPGLRLEISYWRDANAMGTWMENAAHLKARPVGRNEIFSWYKITSLTVDRKEMAKAWTD
jgi:heme-degrading monooxygenase HmoA